MSMKRFFEMASQKSPHVYRGNDRIPGTDKVRTYCGNSSLYTRESSLDRMEGKEYHPTSLKKSNNKSRPNR